MNVKPFAIEEVNIGASILQFFLGCCFNIRQALSEFVLVITQFTQKDITCSAYQLPT